MSVTQVQTSGITNDAVTNSKIGAGAVGNTEIANGAVTNSKIGASAVGNSNIADSAITASKIASGAVDTSEIASEAVTASKLSGGQSGSAPVYGVRAYGIMTNGDKSSPDVTSSGNLDRISRSSNSYTVYFKTDMPSTSYAVALTISSDSDHVCQVTSRERGYFKFETFDPGQSNNEKTTTTGVHIIVVG